MSRSTDSGSGNRNLWLTAIALLCLILVVWLKFYGLLLAAPIIFMTLLLVRNRHDAPETTALRSSIELSAEDISDVIADYDHFVSSPDTDAIADRTLHRPALLDADCADPDIERFHFQCQTNRRFLHRLQARLAGELSVAELEQLLSITDQRATELKESWFLARRSAKRLGPGH
ncbi:hypothetical protein [Corynebacterium halotolerans]|uniref:hypothetical protein n=1 Tax=Corynebacterium halotolerans TaxID=225326 RepID=UPI003CE9E252